MIASSCAMARNGASDAWRSITPGPRAIPKFSQRWPLVMPSAPNQSGQPDAGCVPERPNVDWETKYFQMNTLSKVSGRALLGVALVILTSVSAISAQNDPQA